MRETTEKGKAGGVGGWGQGWDEVRAWLRYVPISRIGTVTWMWAGCSGAGPAQGEGRLAHSCPAPKEQVQHILAHLVVVLVQELVHLERGNGRAAGARTSPPRL